jgi:DNA-binding MarR family transcriptional regulator
MVHGNQRRRIADRLHSAAIFVLRHAREADRKSEIGPAQLSALSVLVFGGPCKIGELAAAEHVSAPTMTRVVQALEARGLVHLERCAQDARSTVVRTSRKGAAVLKKARAARLDRIDDLLAHKANADVALLGRGLDAVFPESARESVERE